MFAVIRHTFELDVKDKYNSVGEWKHLVWLFETELDAMSFAITLLDHPLLVANKEYLAHAIETLREGKFWQVGRESVAVGKVEGLINVSYEDLENDTQKFIH